MAESDEQGHGRLQRAAEIVDLAWRDLPTAHQQLLRNIGAAQHQVIDAPLRSYVADLLTSAGEAPLPPADREDLDRALGAWIPRLQLLLINAEHPPLSGLNDNSYEAMIARTAWHEWGHALSLARATADDIRAGERLLAIAPPGIAQFIRASGYRRREYTHELIAETYALLMTRRRRKEHGQPPWLADEIWALVRRVTGWHE